MDTEAACRHDKIVSALQIRALEYREGETKEEGLKMLAIIPARGKSRRLFKKNIFPLNNKPLISYTINAARNAKLVTDIIVSTDDPAISRVALSYGARVPFLRPAPLAEDGADIFGTLHHVLEYLCSPIQQYQLVHNSCVPLVYEDIIMLFPTSPLRTSADIDNAISLFYEKAADSVISVTKNSHPLPYFMLIDEKHRIHRHKFTATHLFDMQIYPDAYYHNGAIYVFKYDATIRHRVFWTENSYAYIMPPERSVDIDTIQDIHYAECLLKKGKIWRD